MAVRFSLGARRAQVIRQLLMEAFLVALPGVILGLIFCGWAIDFLRSIAHQRLPRADEIQLSWPVVLFTLSLNVATTFLFGLVPAWTASREDTAAALRQGSRGQVAGKQAILQVLVAGQVALAIVLLIGAGLLLHTMASLGSVPLGFETRNVLTFRISAAWSEIKDYRRVQHRLEQTLEKLESIPGVVSAAIVLNPPATGANYNLEIHIVDRDSQAPGEKLLANAPVVSASYFRTLGIPLLAARRAAIISILRIFSRP
jgi:putative ABC transport system permease protein